MEFNIFPIFKKADKSFGRFALWIFRVSAVLFQLVVILGIFLDRDPIEKSTDIILMIQLGFVGVVSLAFFLLKFDLAGLPPQGVVYRVESGNLIVETWNRKGKKLREYNYPLKDLEFIQGGFSIQKTKHTTIAGSSSRVTANTPVTGLYVMRKGDDRPITHFQILGGKSDVVEEMERIALKINEEIARAQGVFLERILEKKDEIYGKVKEDSEFKENLKKAREDRDAKFLDNLSPEDRIIAQQLRTKRIENNQNRVEKEFKGVIWVDYAIMIWLWGMVIVFLNMGRQFG